jgi:hypothetical protein
MRFHTSALLQVVPDPPIVTDEPPCEPGDAECFCKWVGRDGFFPDLSKYSRCRVSHVGPDESY